VRCPALGRVAAHGVPGDTETVHQLLGGTSTEHRAGSVEPLWYRYDEPVLETRRRVLGPADRRHLTDAAVRIFGAEPGVIAVYLYGSAARGEPARDLDVAVLFAGDVDVRSLERLAAALAHEGAPHGPEIDLRPLNRAAPRFQTAVLRDGQVLFERDRRARRVFEAECFSRWADFAPTWHAMRAHMFERWSHG
jgi:predicted nucleotidyltransferase